MTDTKESKDKGEFIVEKDQRPTGSDPFSKIPDLRPKTETIKVGTGTITIANDDSRFERIEKAIEKLKLRPLGIHEPYPLHRKADQKDVPDALKLSADEVCKIGETEGMRLAASQGGDAMKRVRDIEDDVVRPYKEVPFTSYQRPREPVEDYLLSPESKKALEDLIKKSALAPNPVPVDIHFPKAVPEKKTDHTLDAARYALNTYNDVPILINGKARAKLRKVWMVCSMYDPDFKVQFSKEEMEKSRNYQVLRLTGIAFERKKDAEKLIKKVFKEMDGMVNNYDKVCQAFETRKFLISDRCDVRIIEDSRKKKGKKKKGKK